MQVRNRVIRKGLERTAAIFSCLSALKSYLLKSAGLAKSLFVPPESFVNMQTFS